jgi:hypothetical protein
MAKKSRSSGRDEFRALVDRKKEQMRRSQVPTEEDFARAEAHMEAQNRMFATVRDNVFRSFAGRVPLHEIFLFPGPTTDYEAYVFYESDADIEACRGSGVEQAIRDAICQEFASTSDARSPTVAFKFDSHESVKKQCNGNYRKYLG